MVNVSYLKNQKAMISTRMITLYIFSFLLELSLKKSKLKEIRLKLNPKPSAVIYHKITKYESFFKIVQNHQGLFIETSNKN